MNPPIPNESQASCIAVAARFVAAQPGGVQRLLHAHRPRPDGTCTCRTHTTTPWPCAAVTIAHAAARTAQRHQPGDRDTTGGTP